MKQFAEILIAVFVISSTAKAMTVKEGDIVGKTNLVAVAETTVNGQREEIMTDNRGLSLYTFAMDVPHVSRCRGSCIGVWPPQHVANGARVIAPFATIRGNDGQNQLTLNGLPLYHYISDRSPGNAFGKYPNWDVIVVTK